MLVKVQLQSRDTSSVPVRVVARDTFKSRKLSSSPAFLPEDHWRENYQQWPFNNDCGMFFFLAIMDTSRVHPTCQEGNLRTDIFLRQGLLSMATHTTMNVFALLGLG